MQLFESPAERFGRLITVFQRHVDHLAFAAAQFKGSQRQAPAPDVFRERHAGQIGKHALKMVSGAAGEPRGPVVGNLVRQMHLDIIHGRVHMIQPIHGMSLLSPVFYHGLPSHALHFLPDWVRSGQRYGSQSCSLALISSTSRRKTATFCTACGENGQSSRPVLCRMMQRRAATFASSSRTNSTLPKPMTL